MTHSTLRRPDSQGRTITHEFMTAPAQANDILYSVVAARIAFPELSKEFVTLTSSQGGAVVWSAAKKLTADPGIVPGHLGSVALSRVTSILDQPHNSAIIPLLLLMLVPGLASRYPDFKPSEVLSPDGVDELEAYTQLKGCNTVLFHLPSGPGTLRDNWADIPTIKAYQSVTQVGDKPFKGLMLVMKGLANSIVDAEVARKAVQTTARKFPAAGLEYYPLPDVSHAPVMYAGLHVYMDWIKARFRGEAAAASYRDMSNRLHPVRPGKAQQIEANLHIQSFPKPWQMT